MIVGLIFVAALTIAAYWNGWRVRAFLPLSTCAIAYLAYDLARKYGTPQLTFDMFLGICGLYFLVGLVIATVKVFRNYTPLLGAGFLLVPFFAVWFILFGDKSRKCVFNGAYHWQWTIWSANYPIVLTMLFYADKRNPSAFIIPLYLIGIIATAWMAYNKAPGAVRGGRVSSKKGLAAKPASAHLGAPVLVSEQRRTFERFSSAHVWAYILFLLFALAIVLRVASFTTH
jgi:hypothetical protein